MLRTAIGMAAGVMACLLFSTGAKTARAQRGAPARTAPSLRPTPQPGGGLTRPPRNPDVRPPRLRPDPKGPSTPPRRGPRHRPPYPGWPGYWGYPFYGYPSPWFPGWGLYSPYYDDFGYRSTGEREAESDDNIRVRVTPKQAEIRINGMRYGRDGRAELSLPIGIWNIELSAPGYVAQRIRLDVQPGIRYRIERRLEKDATQIDRRRERPDRTGGPPLPQQLQNR